MLNFWIITLFPDLFEGHLKHLPVSRATSKKVLNVELIDLHNYAIDKRGTVDSRPYGGGPGMILRPEPINNAVIGILDRVDSTYNGQEEKPRLIFLTPRGKVYRQQTAAELSACREVIIVCGRYEGIDQRVVDYFNNSEKVVTTEVSIGNYVLSGGEVAAMAVIESVARLIPDVIENPGTLESESFVDGRLEHAQYGRPEVWNGLRVPAELLTGHHKKIREWKKENSPRF